MPYETPTPGVRRVAPLDVADLEHTRRILGHAPVDDAWGERTRDGSA